MNSLCFCHELLLVVLQIEELYSEILYEILHVVGCDASAEEERDALFHYLQEAFKLDNDTHTALMDRASVKELPLLFVHINLVPPSGSSPDVSLTSVSRDFVHINLVPPSGSSPDVSLTSVSRDFVHINLVLPSGPSPDVSLTSVSRDFVHINPVPPSGPSPDVSLTSVSRDFVHINPVPPSGPSPDVSLTSAPNILLNVEVVEARDLTPKDANGSVPTFAWKEVGTPYRPNRDSNPDLPALSTPVQHEIDALDHYTTEVVWDISTQSDSLFSPRDVTVLKFQNKSSLIAILDKLPYGNEQLPLDGDSINMSNTLNKARTATKNEDRTYQYLSNEILQKALTIGKNVLVAWGCEFRATHRDVGNLEINQEEADTKLLLHAAEATHKGATRQDFITFLGLLAPCWASFVTFWFN
uniref:Uncharacterized protein n=1 Tax=Timema monikensis TaxID=170555 RepID=A0A7R9HPR4_9NEOP|nr:unnamed protein product [Timema monikensis]